VGKHQHARCNTGTDWENDISHRRDYAHRRVYRHSPACHFAGMNVVLYYRNSWMGGEALAATLNARHGGSVVTVKANLLQLDALSPLKAAASSEGSLDVLINNAPSFYFTALESINKSQCDELMGVNLKASLFFYPRLPQPGFCGIAAASLMSSTSMPCDYSKDSPYTAWPKRICADEVPGVEARA
jgi:hypothetical protein